MRMDMPYLTLLFDFLVSLVASVFVCTTFFWRFGIRCTRLEHRVLDLEERSTKVAGRELANKRWKSDRALVDELTAAGAPPAPNVRRFDNDPLGRE